MKRKVLVGLLILLITGMVGSVMAYECGCSDRSYPATASETHIIPALDTSKSQCIPDPVPSGTLADGNCYKITASGTYVFGSGLTGDAEWQLRAPSINWQKYGGIAQDEPVPPILDWGDLLIDDQSDSANWAGPFNPLHVYSSYRTGEGEPVTFLIADSGSGGPFGARGSYCDNVGSLTVDLYEADPVPMEIGLYAGKANLCNDPVGRVLVWHDCDNIYVAYVIDDPDWYLMETHFDIVSDPDEFPTTSTGNPKVGQFAFGDEDLWTQEMPYIIALEDLGIDPCEEDVYIATHAVVGTIVTPAPYPATAVVSSSQGLRKDGTPVLAERSDPTKGLVQDYTGSTVNFFSLGFGGTITASFSCPVANGAGDDIAIYEVTNGVYPPETVKVEASQDGANWVILGTGTNGRTAPSSSGSMITQSSFELGSLTSAKYIRITDTSNPSLFEDTADAFDLDGIYSLQNCVHDETAWGSTCDASTSRFAAKGNWATYFKFANPCDDFCSCVGPD